MIECALKMRPAIVTFIANSKIEVISKLRLSNSEWIYLNATKILLEIFKFATDCMSKAKFLTFQQVLPFLLPSDS